MLRVGAASAPLPLWRRILEMHHRLDRRFDTRRAFVRGRDGIRREARDRPGGKRAALKDRVGEPRPGEQLERGRLLRRGDDDQPAASNPTVASAAAKLAMSVTIAYSPPPAVGAIGVTPCSRPPGCAVVAGAEPSATRSMPFSADADSRRPINFCGFLGLAFFSSC